MPASVDLADPEPAAEQIVVAVEAVGIGFVDALMCAGRYQVRPPLPYVPGNEVAGTAVAVSSAVPRFRPGERVVGLAAGGGLAERLRVRTALAVAIPDGVAATTAAAAIVNASTCLYGLIEIDAARAGETLLVLGAGGGTGLVAIDFARAHGLRPIALASTPEKRAAAVEQDATEAFDGSRLDWREAVEQRLGKGAIDLVFDPVGGALSDTAFRMLAPGGRHLVVGFASGGIPSLPFNLPLLKRASLVGVDCGGHIRAHPDAFGEQASRVMAMLADRSLKPVLPRVIAFEEVGAALAQLTRREGMGKIVVDLAGTNAPGNAAAPAWIPA